MSIISARMYSQLDIVGTVYHLVIYAVQQDTHVLLDTSSRYEVVGRTYVMNKLTH